VLDVTEATQSTKDITMSNRDFQTIDPTALAQVSGGATATPTTSTDDQLITALTGILDTLKSINQPSSGGFNQQEMLLLMMMMQQRNQQASLAATSSWYQEPIIRWY
jgi:hypothetical protein